MMKLIFSFLFLFVFIIGCMEKESSDNSTKDKSETNNQSITENMTLPSDAIGIFTGEEPAYSMRVGDKIIPMSSSKWRLEISNAILDMQQVSDGQTIHYSGKYNIEFDDEIKTVIKSQLKDDKYNQDFTPTLRYNKATKAWFLEGVMGSEGCSLEKE